MRGEKTSLFLIALILLSLSITLAAHTITTSTGATSISTNETIQTVINISVSNTDSLAIANISSVNITIPSNFTFNATTNGTNSTQANFTNTSTVLSWTNTTEPGYVVNASEIIFFWFNATISYPGTYNITVTTTNITGSYSTNISVEVNDTTNPTATIGTSPVDYYNSSNTNVTFDLKCTDGYSVNDLVLYGNWTGTWHANQTNASIINNTYWNITVNNIADGLYNWGAYCNDSTGNFDWAAANRTLRVDTTGPVVTLPEYTNATTSKNTESLILNISAIDAGVGASFCKISVGGNINQTIAVTDGWCNSSTINLTTLSDGNQTIEIYVNDTLGNTALSNSYVVVIDTTPPTATIGISPVDYYNSSNTNVTFDLKCADAYSVNDLVLYGNWSGAWIANQTNASVINNSYWNVTVNNIADGTYLWTAYCNDSAGNSDWDAANRTLIIDTTNPTASASCTPSSVNIGATTTCSCTGTDATSGVSTTTASSTPSTTTTGTYTYACTATDFAGNSGNTSATYTVTTDNTNTGGSSSSSTTNFWTTTHTISDTEFKESSTKELSKKQRLKVIINSTAHYVGIIELTTTTATVNISSIPQQAILATGDERKFDVNEDNYYDILVKLNSIKNSKANITIQSINEIITQEEIIKETLKEEATTIKNKEQSERKYWIWIIGIIIGIVIISGITYIILKRKSN